MGGLGLVGDMAEKIAECTNERGFGTRSKSTLADCSLKKGRTRRIRRVEYAEALTRSKSSWGHRVDHGGAMRIYYMRINEMKVISGRA